LSRPIGAKVKQTTFATIKTTSVICSDSAIDSRIAEGTVRRWTNRAEWLTIHASNCQTMQSLTGTVYLIKNELTKFQYIGETLRPIQTRWDEHQSQKIESAGWFFNRAMREYEPTVWTFKELHIVQVDVLDASYLKAAKVHLKEELLKRELMVLIAFLVSVLQVVCLYTDGWNTAMIRGLTVLPVNKEYYWPRNNQHLKEDTLVLAFGAPRAG